MEERLPLRREAMGMVCCCSGVCKEDECVKCGRGLKFGELVVVVWVTRTGLCVFVGPFKDQNVSKF